MPARRRFVRACREMPAPSVVGADSSAIERLISIGWPGGRGLTAVALAHLTFASAYVAIVVRARLTQVDPAIEEAARDLGAQPGQAFWLVTVLLITPALVSGWMLAFTLSLDDLVVASFVSGPGSSSLPMVIYSSVRLGVTPEINALATLLISGVPSASWWRPG